MEISWAVHQTKEQCEIAARWQPKDLSLMVTAKAVGCASLTIVRVLRGNKYEAWLLPRNRVNGLFGFKGGLVTQPQKMAIASSSIATSI